MMTHAFISALGLLAAFLTSLSYIPQVRKSFPRGSTDELSLKMLIALTTGLVLWVIYGWLIGDWIVLVANVIGVALSGSVLAFKIRDLSGGRNSGGAGRSSRSAWLPIGLLAWFLREANVLVVGRAEAARSNSGQLLA